MLSRMARVSSIRVYPGLAFAYIPTHPCTQEKKQEKKEKKKKETKMENKNEKKKN